MKLVSLCDKTNQKIIFSIADNIWREKDPHSPFGDEVQIIGNIAEILILYSQVLFRQVLLKLAEVMDWQDIFLMRHGPVKYLYHIDIFKYS